MAINKVVNKSSKSHGALRNVLEYVLRDEKVKEGYIEIAGPYSGDTITYDEVYRDWLNEKELWNKDSGRMYTHNIISFHKDEQVTPEQVLEIGKAFAEKFFPYHQYVVVVHQDKDHLHCHIVTNTVSYIDGRKLHQTKTDLEKQKEFTNKLCLERGLTVTEKGHRFDGTVIEQGEITAWSKDKYNLLINDSRKSFVAECALAILDAVPLSANREDFISAMEERGWSVQWEDSRKHIVFRDRDGNKVRDTNIEKTFAGVKVSKENLEHEFERQKDNRELALEHTLDSYYSEVETIIAGGDNEKAVECNKEPAAAERGEHERDTEALIRELDNQEKAAREKRDNRIAERKNRDAEQRRLSLERERRVKDAERAAPERGKGLEREGRGHDLER